SASRGVIRADDAPGFVSAFRRLQAILEHPDVAACGEPARHFLVEDFVPGVEVALEGLVADGCLRVLALFDKPDPLDGPFFEETIYVTPSRLPERAERAIAACAQAPGTALGIRGAPCRWWRTSGSQPIGAKRSCRGRKGRAIPVSSSPAATPRRRWRRRSVWRTAACNSSPGRAR